MLKLNEIKPAKGCKKSAKRIGRGQGSGTGSTAGKGNNGYRARKGAPARTYFEGGQTPLVRRLPKRGFFNPFKKEFQIVNVGDLEKIDFEGEISVETLHANGLIHEVDRPVKILGDGDLTKAIAIKVHSFSKTAREKIENAKGKAEVIGRA
ncbi:MAG: 50S ribosomal protein L15 [Fibrobacter sp.]|nr:50S ribosomal protein L15 [Fibrobacter sp.]